jgi:hypothetical protein
MVNNKVYDVIKILVQIILPAFATLYTTLASIWGFPGVTEIVGTTAAIATFLGVFLKLSSSKYNNSDDRYDGDLVVSGTEGGPMTYSLELNDVPKALHQQESVRFKVKQDSLESK